MIKGSGFLNLLLNAIGSTVTARPKTRKKSKTFDATCFPTVSSSPFFDILLFLLLSLCYYIRLIFSATSFLRKKKKKKNPFASHRSLSLSSSLSLSLSLSRQNSLFMHVLLYISIRVTNKILSLFSLFCFFLCGVRLVKKKRRKDKNGKKSLQISKTWRRRSSTR